MEKGATIVNETTHMSLISTQISAGRLQVQCPDQRRGGLQDTRERPCYLVIRAIHETLEKGKTPREHMRRFWQVRPKKVLLEHIHTMYLALRQITSDKA